MKKEDAGLSAVLVLNRGKMPCIPVLCVRKLFDRLTKIQRTC